MSHPLRIKETTLHRIVLMAMSITLILQTMSIDGTLGWRVVFPLIAIYPGITALISWKLRPSRKKLEADKRTADIRYANAATRA